MKYEMFVVAFEGENKAHEVLDELKRLDDQDIVDIKEAAVVVKTADSSMAFSGDDEPDEVEDVVEGAYEGARVGAYEGSATGLGVLIGIVSGAVQGIFHPRTVDADLSDDFLLEVGQALTPGSSAVIAVVEFEKVDQAMQALDRFEGGKILRHTLNQQTLEKLSAAIED